MGRPVFLADNLFNVRTYPGHSLVASTTATGTDILNLSSGRRVRGLSGWSASALNTEATLRAECNRLRAANLLFVDRDHNLDAAGTPQLGIRISNDDFATSSELGPWDIPANPVPHSSLYEDGLIRTHEGALLAWFELDVGWEWEVFVPAMGAGVRPELAGLMLGKLWTTVHQQQQPASLGSGQVDLLYDVRRSPQAQAAAGEIGALVRDEIDLQLENYDEYLEGVYPIADLYFHRKAMVIIPDDEQAENAILAVAPPGRHGFRVDPDWGWPQVTIPYEETEPELVP